MAFISYLLLAILIALTSASNIRPRPLVWSSQTYGPDGPWQAVKVQIGTPGQPVDLYPGGAFDTIILETSVCSDSNDTSSTCMANTAGLYEPLNSTTSVAVPAAGTTQNNFLDGYQSLSGSGSVLLDQLTLLPGDDFTTAFVPSITINGLTKAYNTLADGTIYPALVGILALGAEVPNQTWIEGEQQINGTQLPNFLYNDGQLASASYGLHIGSVQHGIPGSLYLGGYDQLRIVGPVSVQGYSHSNLLLDLLDIGIGVAEGGSPFPYTSKPGLLAQGNNSIRGFIPVEIEPREPYLYLPASTCAAIAQELPVTFQPKYNLYFWNTDDPRYEQIVTSPSFLSFTFRFNNSATQNFTINVPFALLNLTLDAPVISIPTPYFPCTTPHLQVYGLGRSFLQAAFVGVNWETDLQGAWFLAQAPGPNIGIDPNVMTIGPTDHYLVPSQNDWADSWSKTWVPLPANNSTTAATSKYSRSLGIGAIVGISIGGVVLCVLVIFSSWLLWRSRRREALLRASIDNSSRNGPYEVPQGEVKRLPVELYSGGPCRELPNYQPAYSYAELPA